MKNRKPPAITNRHKFKRQLIDTLRSQGVDIDYSASYADITTAIRAYGISSQDDDRSLQPNLSSRAVSLVRKLHQ
jgi:hypothetical protein